MGKTNFSYRRQKATTPTTCPDCGTSIKAGQCGSAECIDNAGQRQTHEACASCATVWLTKITNDKEQHAVKNPVTK
jgi:hypothetical protein